MAKILGEINLTAKSSASVSNNSLFRDSSDNGLKYKDNSGSTSAVTGGSGGSGVVLNTVYTGSDFNTAQSAGAGNNAADFDIVTISSGDLSGYTYVRTTVVYVARTYNTDPDDDTSVSLYIRSKPDDGVSSYVNDMTATAFSNSWTASDPSQDIQMTQTLIGLRELDATDLSNGIIINVRSVSSTNAASNTAQLINKLVMVELI